jgi:hypothetical protein
VQFRKSAPTDVATISTSTSSTEVPADIPKKIKAGRCHGLTVSRNQPLDNIDDSSVYKEEQRQRPRKKARIDVHALVFPELYNLQPCPRKKSQLSARDESAF